MTLLEVYRRQPLTAVRGRGAWLEDAQGRRYVDLVAGVGVNALGHGDARVVDAITAQAASLVHCSNLYSTQPQTALAKRLCDAAGMHAAFFCNSGAEAVEAAIKSVRKFWYRAGDARRRRILYASGSFHGRTLAALAVTDNAAYRAGFDPLPAGFERIAFNGVDAVPSIDESVAAVIVEPVQGESGVHAADPVWLSLLEERCRATGALLVFDEIQCGLGRTGTLFAFERYGVRPDILLLAKALGGGLPLGALLLDADASTALRSGDHGSTFGGNPVACAAGLALLDVLDEAFLKDVRETSARMEASLWRMQRRLHASVSALRCAGMMAAIELRRPLSAADVVSRALERGVLVTTAGANAVRLLPPLSIDASTLQLGLDRLETAMRDAATAVENAPA